MPNTDKMEMPTPCQHCGDWFDLHDGCASEKWYPNTVICEKCAQLEEKIIEVEEEIADIQIELENAKWDVEHYTKQLGELTKTLEMLNQNT
jgi:hypothetical protein